jgi:hypothetical protein
MKNYIALLLTAVLLFSGGCASKKTSPKLDPAAAADKLVSSVKFTDEMSPVDKTTALKLYGLDQSAVSDVKAYESTGATAEEIAVFEVKDEAAQEKVKKAAQRRIEDQRAGFRDYQPKEMTKLKNPVLVTSGNYVFLCICDDNAAVQKSIDSLLKNISS